ncbi:cytochrome c oxidase assembly protein [soil metagenome]|jgi:putative membrane protein
MSDRPWRPYCGPGPTPGELLGRWNLDPVLLASLVGLAVVLWSATRGAPRRRRWALAALTLLIVTFVSPLCALSSALFAARTAHHILLVALAAPLLALSCPPARAKLPLSALTVLHIAILWAWHIPAAYSAALADTLVYAAMQVTLLGSAVLFWRAAWAARPWPGAFAFTAAMMQMGLLGALITLAPFALYAPHLATTAAWGLSPLEDQQLAGLIMWIPAGGIYLAAAIASARRALVSPRPTEAKPLAAGTFARPAIDEG